MSRGFISPIYRASASPITSTAASHQSCSTLIQHQRFEASFSFLSISSPPNGISSQARPPSLCFTPLRQQTRHASTTRRHRKLLNLAPSPGFGGPQKPTGSSGKSQAVFQQRPEGDHIIFDPAPSAPNVYHTPLKFLPRGDVRRTMYEKEAARHPTLTSSPTSTSAPTKDIVSNSASLSSMATPFFISSKATSIDQTGQPVHSNSNTTWPSTSPLPPAVSAEYTKKYHLGEADIGEIRRLRLENEKKWTRTRLARKFNCSRVFVSLVVQASQERKAEIRKNLDRKRRFWGTRKRLARMDRVKRWEIIARDE